MLVLNTNRSTLPSKSKATSAFTPRSQCKSKTVHSQPRSRASSPSVHTWNGNSFLALTLKARQVFTPLFSHAAGNPLAKCKRAFSRETSFAHSPLVCPLGLLGVLLHLATRARLLREPPAAASQANKQFSMTRTPCLNKLGLPAKPGTPPCSEWSL